MGDRERWSRVASAFDLVLDQRLNLAEAGGSRPVIAEEALQRTLLQKAFAGDRPAIRKCLKMIERRQAAMKALRATTPVVRTRTEAKDPDNANEALRLLGIGQQDSSSDWPGFKLHTWAVQTALDRRGAPKLTKSDMALIRNSCLERDSLRWPKA